MIPDLRRRYNAAFRQARYDAFLRDLNTARAYPADFKVAETPLFLTGELAADALRAGDEIIDTFLTPDFRERTRKAIPPGWEAPNEDAHTTFLQIDFALCLDERGNVVPQLIELQGFPSLYGFQILLDEKLWQHFDLPAGFTAYFDGLDRASAARLLRDVIAGDADPEQTILLEVQPEKQKTRIDFACTEALTGVRAVCLTSVIKRGRKLFYERGGREIPIERIYSRLIREDMEKLAREQGLRYGFDLADEIDAKWVGHPNWFFKISKASLPLLKSRYVPAAHFLSDLDGYPGDLENYVLKPLYSFSGQGIELDVTPARLDGIPDRENYLLQRKVDYAPLVETPDGPATAELRMLYLWPEGAARPRPVTNLLRMSKGRMMGVRYNAGLTWVGSTIAYFAASVSVQA